MMIRVFVRELQIYLAQNWQIGQIYTGPGASRDPHREIFLSGIPA